MNSNRIFSTAAAFFALLASASSSSAFQTPADEIDPQHELARTAYRPDTWAQGGLRAGFALGTVEVDGFQGAAVEGAAGRVVRRFGSADPAIPGFMVEMIVSDDLTGAREQLLSWLAGVSSPQPVPRSTELGIEIGEVAYVGRSRYGNEHPQWIGFVRGNIAVRLQAHDLRTEPRVSLVAAARRIDAEIAKGPVLAANENVPHPSIDVLGAQSTSLVAGEKTRIGVDAVDALDGEVQLAWILAGPATGYVERGEDGAWYLHTTGAGALELTVEALGSNGTFARRSIRLQVARE
jgi:hypothetical protein